MDYETSDTFILEVKNPAGGAMSWDLPQDGAHAEAVIEYLTPGESSVACVLSPRTGRIEFPEDAWVPLQIVDTNGWFVEPKLTCDAEHEELSEQRIPGIVPSEAESAIRTALTGLLADDVVELTGYPDAERSNDWTWRVVRDGVVVARIEVGTAGGGYLYGTACADAGISVP